MSEGEYVESCTVAEAVALSGKSEATVRRELGRKLVKVQGLIRSVSRPHRCLHGARSYVAAPRGLCRQCSHS